MKIGLRKLVHDLRASVSAIHGGTHLLMSDRAALSREQREDLDLLAEGTRTLERLLSEYADCEAMMAGEHDPCLAPTTLQAVVDRALTGLEHPVDVALPDGPMPMRADLEMLARAVRILIRHAHRHDPRGARITGSRSGGRALLAVSDGGPPITHRFAEMLFDADGSCAIPAGHRQSTGLGLPLCRLIVERHHGRVAAVDASGARIEVSLPLQDRAV